MRDRRGQRLRSRVGEAFLAMFFALAPSEVPAWRSDPTLRPVAVLALGEPMTPFPVTWPAAEVHRATLPT